MLRKRSLVMIMISVCSSVCLAQDHPNLSGTWKLNPSKSQLSEFSSSARTDVITQDGSQFTDKVTATNQMGDSSYTLTFTADGKKVALTDANAVNIGMLSVSDITAQWNGAQLVLNITEAIEGNPIPEKDTYELSSDGKTLTISQQSNTPMGEMDSKLSFDKQ
jgi:hypothetical protein